MLCLSAGMSNLGFVFILKVLWSETPSSRWNPRKLEFSGKLGFRRNISIFSKVEKGVKKFLFLSRRRGKITTSRFRGSALYEEDMVSGNRGHPTHMSEGGSSILSLEGMLAPRAEQNWHI
jgi:hypothetical protein